jgi:DNA-binding NarL/FixJ family response regulator
MNSGRSRTVLVVDDDPHIVKLLTILCDMQGYEVVGQAINGFQAEDLARLHSPSLIVLDYMLPFMNGDVTARNIRKIVPHAKILAVSGVIDSKPAWADAFLPKTKVEDLVAALDNLYQGITVEA